VQGSGIFNITEGDLLDQDWLILNQDYGIISVQVAGIFNIANGDLQGVQGSGVFNLTEGKAKGAQGAGIFNYAGGDFQGIQAAGIFNYTAGSFLGLQAGIVNMAMGDGGSGAQFGVVNISKSENMVTVGLVNVVKNGLMHPSIFYDDMGFVNAGFRSGSKHVYSLFTVGVRGKTILGISGEDALLSSRMGLGLEYTIGKFFMDLDLSLGSIIDLDTVEEAWDSLGDEDRTGDASSSIAQLRFTAGQKIFEHLGVFAGISYDYIYRHEDSSPDPETVAPFMIGASFGRHIHKLGFFGGVQF
jgi:hypothetical protein